MDPTTKDIKFDITPLVRTEESYVTTTNDFSLFYNGATTKELIDDFFTDKSTYELDLLVSTSEKMLHGEIKVLIMVAEKFYHFFIDSLPLILKIHKTNPGVRFVLYLQRAKQHAGYEDFLVLLFKILEGEGVKYSIISTVPDQDLAPVYKFRNYVLIDTRTVDLHSILSLVDIQYAAGLAMDYSIPTDASESEYTVAPYRKVYLSLNGRGSHMDPTPDDYEYYRDDIRIDDERKLEEYFRGLGYEVIDPAEEFKSIMYQIAYMTQVKTLVSMTSSGLTNMIFMQPNQTVVEIQAELVMPLIENAPGVSQEHLLQRLHPFYQVLSYMRGHLFVSIPSHRNPDEVIETLSSDRMREIL